MKFELLNDPVDLKTALLIEGRELAVIGTILEPFHANNYREDETPHPLSQIATHIASFKFNIDKPAGISIKSEHFSWFMHEMSVAAKKRVGGLLIEREALTSQPPDLLLWSVPSERPVTELDMVSINEDYRDKKLIELEELIIDVDLIAFQFAHPDNIYFNLY